MSKPFPAIRFHGNNLACVRHVKRGMLELFKTEELQKKMGVPILRRTIEVNEHTSIMIHIAKKQTFIHITSNPPELPEQVAVTEEEEPDYFLCPYSFLIRKRDYIVKSMPQVNFDDDGYLIAYDHGSRNWRVASFKGRDGSTVPYAANLGWYHAKNDAQNGITKCDIVTWHGQPAPDFSAPYMNLATFGFGDTVGPLHFLETVFYFQGRKLTGPGVPVVGACILQDGDTKYFYLHCVGLSTFDYGGGTESFVTTDRVYRKPYSATMAGTSGGWELVHLTSYGTSGLPYDAQTGSEGFYPPRSCSYIDENGLSYFIREYSCNTVTLGIDDELGSYTELGLTAFIEFNLRTGQYKILSTSVSSAADAVSVRVGGGIGDAYYSNFLETPQDDPWVFYVWPGTKDLYYAAVRGVTSTNASYEEEDIGSGDNLKHWTGNHDYHLEIVIYKNFKEHEVLPAFESRGAFTADEEGEIGQPKILSSNVSLREYLSRFFLEYHPEMPSITRSVTTTADTVEVTTYLEDEYTKSDTLCFSEFQPTTVLVNHDLSGDFRGELAYGSPFFDISSPAGTYIYEHALNHSVYDRAGINSIQTLHNLGNSIAGNSAVLEALTDCVAINDAPVAGFFAGTTCFGFGLVKTSGNFADDILYGSGGVVSIVTRLGDGDNRTFFRPDSYAIQKEVPGLSERPYLYLRKKIRPAFVPRIDGTFPTGQIPIFAPFSWQAYTYQTLETEPSDPATEYTITFWSEPSKGYSAVPEDPQDPNVYLDTSEWELLSNFITAEELNRMTKETGNAFFDIGIL